MDIHSTTSNNLTKHLTRSSAMKVLFAAMFLVTAAFESLAEETFLPTSMTVSEAQACVGDDLTVTIVAPDTAGANSLQSVPWQVSYNGSILSATELSDYITLDVATGSSLEDWLTSMILDPARSCMTSPDVTIGEMPSSMRVPRLDARITRIQ